MRSYLPLLALVVSLSAAPILQHLWSSPTYPFIPAGIAVSDGGSVAITGISLTGSGSLYVFSPFGTLLTNLFYSAGLNGINYDKVFVMANRDELLVLNHNGAIIKTIPSSPVNTGQVAVDSRSDLVITCNVNCAAYRLSDGKKLWETKLEGLIVSSPTISKGYVYVPDASSMRIYIINEKTGTIVNRMNFNKPVTGVAACKNYLAVTTSDKLYLYDISHPITPKKLWTVNLKAFVHSLTISPDCKYIAVGSNKLYIYNNEGKLLSSVNTVGAVERIAWNYNRLALLFNINGSMSVSVFKVIESSFSSYGTPTTRYVLNFHPLTGVRRVIALTYPSVNGVVYLFAQTDKGNEIITMKNGKVIGTFKLPPRVLPVYDSRYGEYATYQGKLLLVINDTIYGIYGSNATKIARLRGAHALSIVKIDNEIYAIDAYASQEKNGTVVHCIYYDALNGMREIANYTFNLGKQVGRYTILPDTLDAKGCIVVWTKIREPQTIYFWYKGEEGNVRTSINTFKERLYTFALIYLETGRGVSHPFEVLVTPGSGMDKPLKLKLIDIITKESIEGSLLGPYTAAGIGDYTNKGYLGDLALLESRARIMYIYIVGVNGKSELIKVGRVQESTALLSGLAYYKGSNVNVIGIGNFTGAMVDIKSNLGTLKFYVKGLTVAPSSLGILIGLGKNKMCYTAVINPETRNLITGAITPIGSEKVYVASGCTSR